MGAVDVASEKLRFVVEAELPAPIARDFARVAGVHGIAAGPIAANLLGALLRHAAFVLVADRLARGATPEQRKRITTDLRAAPSHGQLWGLARDLADAFTGEVEGGPAPRLAARLTDRVMREHLDAAIALRNEVIKKGGVNDGDALKRAAIDAVRQLVFLREFPLVVITTMTSRDQLHVYEANLLVGTGEARARLETDLDLIVGHVYLIDPIARVALDLHPLYIATPQLAWLSRASSSPQFEAGDGQASTRKELAGDVVELVEGRGAKLPVARLLALRGAGHETERRRLAAGDVVANRYRVVQLVGAGGMANVYEVIDTGDGDATRALKVLPYDYIRDRAMLARFRREAEDTKLLDHPNVMPTLASGEDVGDNFLVMPLATGWPRLDGTRALDASQLAHPVPLADVLAIGKQVAEALHYVHDKGIVHRDLKPRNLLLDEADRRVRLSDFGVARTADAMTLTMTGLGIGTPEYMAPEQLDGADPEPSADLYGLGAVLYELLTGEPPFTGKTPLAVMRAVASKPPPDPRTARADTPAALAQLVKRLLAKDPAKRPRTAWQVYRVLAGEETLAPDEPEPAPEPESIEGRYRIVRRLGAGTVAETFEATNTRTETRVLLKRFVSRPDNVLNKLMTTAIAASKLHHAAIDEMIDSYHEPSGALVLVSRFREGTILQRLVENGGALAAARVRAIGKALAEGLAAAHAAGLVHGDLKPSSIFVERDTDHAVVLDFGIDALLARPAQHMTVMIMSSPEFAAPEQMFERGTPTREIDVYGLGAILYYALTARPPRDAKSFRQLEPDPPSRHAPGIPEALEKVVLAALAHEPTSRPTIAKLLADLRAAADDRVIDGRYRLGRKVADSGLSETFEADDIRTNTHVILKLFRSGFGAPTAEAFARFASVAAAASQLAHPTIARLLDAHLDGEGEVYTVAELVAGENLHDRVMRDGPLSVALARTLVAQLADGLASAHAAGLVHRDIKPANILVGGERPVLLDFGVDQIVYAPRVSMANTATGGMLMCSPTYMAPELVADSAIKAAPGDVYSLGAALYFLLTGKPPIDGNSNLELLRRLDDDVVKPSKLRGGIPAGLDRLVLAMLAKDAGARPSMTEVATRLRAEDTARRWPVLPIAIAVALVIAILVAVLK